MLVEILVTLLLIYCALLLVSLVLVPLCNLLMGDLLFDGFWFSQNAVFIVVALFFFVAVLGGK